MIEGKVLERWWARVEGNGRFAGRFLHIGVREAVTGQNFRVKIELEPVERGRDSEACLSETREEQEDRYGDDVTRFVQAILDAAWDAGMRPGQARDATEELRAVRYHLEDMRALAFGRPKP